MVIIGGYLMVWDSSVVVLGCSVVFLCSFGSSLVLIGGFGWFCAGSRRLCGLCGSVLLKCNG